MENFETFRWNFLSSSNSEIWRSEYLIVLDEDHQADTELFDNTSKAWPSGQVCIYFSETYNQRLGRVCVTTEFSYNRGPKTVLAYIGAYFLNFCLQVFGPCRHLPAKLAQYLNIRR